MRMDVPVKTVPATAVRLLIIRVLSMPVYIGLFVWIELGLVIVDTAVETPVVPR